MVLNVVCNTQVPEAQQQEDGQLQCVNGAVPNGVEHVLHHTKLAATRGDTLLVL